MIKVESKLKSNVALNYFPVVQAATHKFLQVVEHHHKMQVMQKEQAKKLMINKKSSSNQTPVEQANDTLSQMVKKGVDLMLLKFIRSCCLNLQPSTDNQQFIDIEKKLMPLFRQMTEDVLAPY